MRDYDSLRLTQPGDKRHDLNEYQQVVRKLIYTIVYIRPDIAFTLGKLS